jgi:hypothetical protein
MSNKTPTGNNSIPSQLTEYPLIKVCQPDCAITNHGNCNHPGKRPVHSVDNDKPYSAIRRWIRSGGNYGIVPRSNNDLVIVDSDSRKFEQVVRSSLPDTFTVNSSPNSFHFYYRSEYSGNESFKNSGSEFGSIRTDSWHAVGPGSAHPESDSRYTVSQDKPIQPIPEEQLSDLVEDISSTVFSSSREDGGGGGGGGQSSRRKTKAKNLEITPTNQTLRTLGFINSDSHREKIAKVIDHQHPPRNIRVWMGGWLHSVAGLTESQICQLLRARADWATDESRISVEVQSLIQSSVNSYRADESVNLKQYLSDDDSRQGSRLSEDSRTLNTNMDYNTKEQFTVYKANSVDEAEDGDRVIRVELTNMTGRGDDGEPVDTDFVSITKGTLRDNGEFGVSPEFPGDSKSVGSADPDDLRLIADGLKKIADKTER